MDMKNKAKLTLSLLASLALSACGGGGGDGGNSAATPSSSSASSPSVASAPATASAPAVASAPAPASSPALNGEQLPSLASPQSGSAAAVGNGVEGIWVSQFGVDKTTALVDPQGNISYLNTVAGFGISQFFGVIAATSPNWTLSSGSAFISNFYYPATNGSGSFVNNQTFTGSYVENGNTVNLSWNYDAANALAVTQSSVAGTWAQTGSSLTIASDGTLSGTLSNCPVSGTLLLATPSSAKNLYTLNVTGTTASCTLKSGATYTGNAAITFLPITGSNLYVRTIFFMIKTVTNTTVAYGQLTKQ
ncbi:hypothetical protein [Paraburkholderia aromaticivorans]|uniref:Lipoprotein n=1 Tax=Paraburkholderia aromaticivorans TaxID=2026199 RepID=A0A248VHB3_9BURK|nr:hypothetical protein [Paraburkholderia aromaticivorans]ASV98368.1 hypothetical protein CJU94_09390 [Paraburkholderia aromaticivorans]